VTGRARRGIATGALRSCLGLGLALAACRNDIPATEIVVTIDTTFGVPCTIDGLRIDAVGDGETVTREISLFDHTLPNSIALYPLTTARHATVTVTAMRNGDVFATATERTDFENESSRELRFVLDRNCVPGPCPAIGVGRFVEAPPRMPRRGCGEDGYGWRDAFLAMRDACTMREAIMGTLLVNVDEDEQMIPVMPFPFWFYNELVTQVWVGDNGYIGLGNAKPEALIKKIGAPRSLGEPGFPGRGALAFWDDLRTSTAGVCYAVSGAFPDRILWITWKDACFANDTGDACGPARLGTLTFGMALEETTNRVYMGYRNMTATMANADRAKGSDATIGITNAAPRACKSDLCSPEGTCQDGGACGYTEFSPGKILPSFPTLEFDPL
jgi:hypothetical protein